MRVVKVVATCDIDSEEFDSTQEPINFAWQGKQYEIDLCDPELHLQDLTMADLLNYGREFKPEAKSNGKKRVKSADLPDSEKPFTCGLCPMRFVTERGLTRHRTVTHGGITSDDTATWQDFIDYDGAEYRCIDAGAEHNFGPWKTETGARRHYAQYHQKEE